MYKPAPLLKLVPLIMPVAVICLGNASAIAETAMSSGPLQLQTLQSVSLQLPHLHQHELLVAQDFAPSYCNEFESTFVAVETDNFFVSICGGDVPGTYVGVDKTTGDSIRLPLFDYSANGGYFEAVNGAYTYILSRTPRGNFLTVSRGTQELLREYTWQNW